MSDGSRTWWMPEGPQFAVWIGILGSVCTIVASALSLLTTGYTVTGALLISAVVMMCGILFWRSILRLRNAMSLTLTWGEALHAGVTWGWNRNSRDQDYMPLDVLVTTNRISRDPAGRDLVALLRENSDRLDLADAVLYYDFPTYADYETVTDKPDAGARANGTSLSPWFRSPRYLLTSFLASEKQAVPDGA